MCDKALLVYLKVEEKAFLLLTFQYFPDLERKNDCFGYAVYG